MAGPRPVVLSGPSGAGKTTLLNKLLKEYDSVFGRSVSRKYSALDGSAVYSKNKTQEGNIPDVILRGCLLNPQIQREILGPEKRTAKVQPVLPLSGPV